MAADVGEKDEIELEGLCETMASAQQFDDGPGSMNMSGPVLADEIFNSPDRSTAKSGQQNKYQCWLFAPIFLLIDLLSHRAKCSDQPVNNLMATGDRVIPAWPLHYR